MARILFINRVYPPRFGTSGRLLRDLARACVKIGHDVTILTAGRTESTHAIGGKFRLEQVTDNTTPNLFSNLVLFYRLQKRAKKLPKFDLVITLSDPPGLFWLGQRIAKKHRAKHIHWCHDVYPDLLGAQYPLIPDVLLKPLIGWGRKIMARADAVVAISGCMQRYLQRTGFSGLNLTRLDHWPDPALRNDFAIDKQPDDHELQVLYVGSLDEGTHPMETVLNAAAMLVETDRDITFTFVGRGDGFQKLQQTRARRGLENVRLLPPQPLQNQIAFLQSGAVRIWWYRAIIPWV